MELAFLCALESTECLELAIRTKDIRWFEHIAHLVECKTEDIAGDENIQFRL